MSFGFGFSGKSFRGCSPVLPHGALMLMQYIWVSEPILDGNGDPIRDANDEVIDSGWRWVDSIGLLIKPLPPSIYCGIIGDSYTANGTTIATLLERSNIQSVVNSGIQGDTLVNMTSRFSTFLDRFFGENTVPNGEMSNGIVGWTKLGETGSIGGASIGRLALTNTEALDCAAYSSQCVVLENTEYELSINRNTSSTVTDFEVWVGVTGDPFDESVLAKTLWSSVSEPFAKRLTIPTGVTSVYVGVANTGAVDGQVLYVDSISLRQNIRPTIVALQGGINDIDALHYTFEQMRDAKLLQIAACEAAGIPYIIYNVAPYGLLSDPEKIVFAQYKEWVDQITDVDIYSALDDPANPGSLNPLYAAADQLHLNDDGYELVADLVYSAIVTKLTTRTPLNLTFVSGDNWQDWVIKFPVSTKLWTILGIDSDYFDASGTPKEVVYAGMANDTTLFAGEDGVAVYATDMSAYLARIYRVLKQIDQYGPNLWIDSEVELVTGNWTLSDGVWTHSGIANDEMRINGVLEEGATYLHDLDVVVRPTGLMTLKLGGASITGNAITYNSVGNKTGQLTGENTPTLNAIRIYSPVDGFAIRVNSIKKVFF